MKKINKIFALTSFLFLFFAINTSFAQAKKPTIMIVPSDAWCNQNGYMKTYSNQGETVSVPDYKKAFQENTNLLMIISKINGLMAERGFPLKNLESEIKTEKSKLTDKVKQIEKINEFLKKNSDSWTIKDDKIQFTNLIRMTEYYNLLNKLAE